MVFFQNYDDEEAASFGCRTNGRFLGVDYIYDDTSVIRIIIGHVYQEPGRMNPELGHKNKQGLRIPPTDAVLGGKEERAD